MTDPAAAARPTGAEEAPPGRNGASPAPPRLPVPPRAARFLVLLAVFVCAACGLVYELALVALGSYLLGDTILQASVVMSVMVFAMGVGSLASKRLTGRPEFWFAVVEGLLSLVGGLSILGLYAAFAWFSLYQPALVLAAFAIGALIGAEIPLLMTLIQRIRRQEAASAVADLFAADYIGGLVGGLAFPLALLPLFGLVEGTLLVGAVNAVVGVAVVLWLFRDGLTRWGRVALAAGLAVVLTALGTAFALSGRFEVDARQALYRDPVVYAQRSDYQEIVLTQTLDGADTRLFLNGDLQFCSLDEYRYHESLVHPAMNGPRGDVLVLGGGDGLALREILRYPDVRGVTLVDLDPAVVDLARTEPEIARLNEHSFADERVEVVSADAFNWLRGNGTRFDVVIADMPDPDDVATAKLYSVEFYSLVRRALAPGGRLVVQAGSPYFAPDAFWSIGAGLAEAGWQATPYNVDVPSFGNWGYFLAAPGDEPPPVELPDDHPGLRFLDDATLEAALVFPKDRRPDDPVAASTLLDPRIIDYQRDGWRGY
ncbi:polyamine aminopropyltransferase [Marinitenerispora sediminis]|uniref:Polyamine aminopropyltransferase n=1 Tax=Marinitenerispora sediminis TaxID=1931232 RepID=A0A368T6F0_9ACTN|nr:polyamine aminopropyltransferase [Marinitenerispora sediminis]RCV49186.1 polyamine aminopropyltransferase [Marinitenerispora sediminis]RCV51997.1 polyamine aminopropyltransferase [Marinitenerispora sediminis]RCV56056.1 polyamine aminopropyltransferase [Marinitenerispora sediminis]